MMTSKCNLFKCLVNSVKKVCVVLMLTHKLTHLKFTFHNLVKKNNKTQ